MAEQEREQLIEQALLHVDHADDCVRYDYPASEPVPAGTCDCGAGEAVRTVYDAGLLRAPVGQDETYPMPAFVGMIKAEEAEAPGEYVSIPVPPSDELVERMAGAAYEALGYTGQWQALADSSRDLWREAMGAALRALGEA